MAAVDVADAAGDVIVYGEKQRREGTAWGVFAKKLIDGAEKTLRVVASNDALAAKIGLQIGHEQGGGDALAGNIADDEAEAVVAEAEKVVVVAADLAGLMANSSVIEGAELGEVLREEPRLNAGGDFNFLGGPALGFEAFLMGPALGLDRVSDFVKAHE